MAPDRVRLRPLLDRLTKPLAVVLLSLPLLWLADAVRLELIDPGSALGADPAEAVVHHLGTWGLRFLLLAVLVSPLRRRLGWPALGRCRRLVGLFAFAYLALHFTAYLGLLAGFDGALIREDLTQRPYIIAGGLGLLLLVPLAVSSTRGWQRRLGRGWRRLHRLVFPAVGLGLLHLLWLTKDGYGELAVYLLIFAAALLERLLARRASSARSRSAAAAAAAAGSRRGPLLR